MPFDLEQIVLNCLAKDPRGRPPSASALLVSLLACEDAPRYDRTTAIAWWRKHRAKRHLDGVHVATESPATMAVDFSGRSAPPAATTNVG